jgi:hypothetical protein
MPGVGHHADELQAVVCVNTCRYGHHREEEGCEGGIAGVGPWSPVLLILFAERRDVNDTVNLFKLLKIYLNKGIGLFSSRQQRLQLGIRLLKDLLSIMLSSLAVLPVM